MNILKEYYSDKLKFVSEKILIITEFFKIWVYIFIFEFKSIMLKFY